MTSETSGKGQRMNDPLSNPVPGPGDALVIIDPQNDFLPGGSLAVPHSGEILAVINRYLGIFRERGLPVYATRDWHPKNHCSFKPQGGPWPGRALAAALRSGHAGGRVRCLTQHPAG